MNYRKEIDGLRALAVAPIILFHADFGFIDGGFLGVDIFFVISGYLITSILLRDLAQGTFSLTGFYERRARRILPALFFMMASCVVVSPFFLLPSELLAFAKSLIAVSTFSSNFLFWSESGYFDIAGHLKPLLHTWSLSVEEQYYLFYPIFLMGIWKFARRRLATLLGLVGLGSLFLAHWGAFHRAGATFYLLPTRGWELVIGGLAALYLIKRNDRPFAAPISELFGMVGLILIVGSMVFFTSSTPHPSAYTLMPTIGAALVILFAGPRNYAGRILSNPCFVGLGLVSYSAYLWHQPIFAFFRIYSISQPSHEMMSVLCILVLFCAYLSWRYVERPFRDRTFTGRKWVAIGAMIGSAFFVGIGTAGILSRGFEQAYLMTLNDRQAKLWRASHDRPNDIGCKFPTAEINAAIESRFSGCAHDHGKAIVVLGDSHGIDMYQAISLNSRYPFIVGLVQGGCRPQSPDPECHLPAFSAFINKHSQQILKVFYNQAGLPLLASAAAMASIGPDHDGSISTYVTDSKKLQVTIDYLKSIAGMVSTVWLGPSLEPGQSVKLVRKLAMSCRAADIGIDVSLDAALRRLDRDLKSTVLDQTNHIEYFSTIDALKFSKQEDIYDCNAIYWVNGDHWSLAGEERFGARIVNQLRELKIIEY